MTTIMVLDSLQRTDTKFQIMILKGFWGPKFYHKKEKYICHMLNSLCKS